MGGRVRCRLHLVEFRLVFLGCALLTGGSSGISTGNAGGFHEKEIAQPGGGQRHDLVFVFTDEAEALAFVQPAQLSYQGFERPKRSYVKYVIRHPAIVPAFRAIGKGATWC